MSECAEDTLVKLGRQYRPALITYFMRRIRNAAEAEDLTQEVLVRLLELKSDEVKQPEAYIFSIAANIIRDRHRRNQVRENWRNDVLYRESGTDLIDPLRHVEANERLRLVSSALSELSRRSREILLLFRLERMRKKEIAASYGISVSAVDKHIIRATAHLTRRLEEDE